MTFWTQIDGARLAQGDYLHGCSVPVMPVDFRELTGEGEESAQRVPVQVANLIVMTQSCDLENKKAPSWLAARCTHFREFEKQNPDVIKRWEMVRQGRVEGLHLLAGFDFPDDNRQALVVNFRQIFSPANRVPCGAGWLAGTSLAT